MTDPETNSPHEFKGYLKETLYLMLKWMRLGWRYCFERAKSVLSLIKRLVKKSFQILVYFYRLVCWYAINVFRLIRANVHFFANFLRPFIYVLVAAVLGWVVVKFSPEYFTQDILSGYLFTVGAMIGGTISIVLTISNLTTYPSSFTEVRKSGRERSVFFLVALITLLFLGTGLYVGGLPPTSPDLSPVPPDVSAIIVLVSLLLLAVVFILLDWLYKGVKEKANPFLAIAVFEKNSLKNLDVAERDAERIAGIMQAKDTTLSKDMGVATAYNVLLQARIAKLERDLQGLIEAGLKYAELQELYTTKRAFSAVYNLLARYFDARKTSSLVLPSGIAFLAVQSDSQSFLSRIFEQLNSAGEKFIKENKSVYAVSIIDIYKALAIKSQEISFIGRTDENPILDLIVGYLQFLIDKGLTAKDNEVVYQGAQALGEIAAVAAGKGYGVILYGLQDYIFKIANYGINEKFTIIVDQCTTNYLRMIAVIFEGKKIVREHSYDGALKNIAKITGYFSASMKSGYLRSDFSTRMTLSKGYDDLQIVIGIVMNHYTTLTDEREKQRYRRDIVGFFDELGMSLRQLSESIKDADSTLIDSIGRLLTMVNELLVDLTQDEEFKKEIEDLKKCLYRNIYLPAGFAINAQAFDAGSNSFHTLTDSVARTGIIIAERIQDKRLLKACVDSLSTMTEEALEKTTDKYGFDEPRIMKKASYIGILALKKGWRDIFAEVGAKILTFEPKYAAKYFSNLPAGIDPAKLSPNKDQLFIELLRWRDNFDHERLNGSRLLDDAETMMYSLIAFTDIDRFMFELWRKFPADSPISEELEKRGTNLRLLHILRKVLKKKHAEEPVK